MGIERALVYSFLACVFIALVLTSASGATIIVDRDWPGADFDNLQMAVNAAEPGDTVRVHDGTHNGSLHVNKTVSIIGNGTNTIIRQKATDYYPVISADGCRLSNVRIVQDVYDTGIEVSANDIMIDNVTVNAYYNGIHVIDSTNVSLFHVTGQVHDERDHYNILFEHSMDCTVRWNHPEEGQEYNIGAIDPYGNGSKRIRIADITGNVTMEGSENITIERIVGRVDVEKSDDGIITGITNGIDVDESSGMIIKNNTLAMRSGISVSRSENCTIRGNSISGGQTGLYAGGNNISISNNSIRWNEYGINVNSLTNSIIENNTITGVDKGIHGGYWSNYGNHKVIIRNNLIEADQAGIRSMNDGQIINNTMINCGLVVCGGDQSVIEDNTMNGLPIVYWYDREAGLFTGKVGQAILYLCRNVTVAGVIANDGSSGIEIDMCWNLTIDGNKAWGNSLYGIRIANSYKCTIASNHLSNNGRHGLFLVRLKLSSVTNNDINHNDGYGIFNTYSCEEVTYSGNDFRSNGIAGYLHEPAADDPHEITVEDGIVATIIAIIVINVIIVHFYSESNRSKR